jgi:hypothetical protein
LLLSTKLAKYAGLNGSSIIEYIPKEPYCIWSKRIGDLRFGYGLMEKKFEIRSASYTGMYERFS